jgi:PKD repeat protein
VAAAGCTVKKTEQPPLSGPSELSLSLSLAANPDTLTQDGFSQSQIVIRARDGSSQPVRSLAVRVDIAVDGIIQDFGRLSAKNVVTGSDGAATVVYTAPESVDSVDRQTSVSIRATPFGADATAQTPRSITIKLVPPGIITPPPGTAPDFSFTPETPAVSETVNFVAVESADVVSYAWSFGDGGTASGRIVDHVYRDPGNYLVTLTAVDATGARSTLSKDIQVQAGVVPTALFTYSPGGPTVNQTVFFNAAASTAAAGRTLVGYKWDFGDGSSGSGSTTSHKYSKAGTFTVNLIVTDDAGLKGSSNVPVTVAPAP